MGIQLKFAAWVFGFLFFAGARACAASALEVPASPAAIESDFISTRSDGLWFAKGIRIRELPDGKREAELGNGVRRIDSPDGHSELFGLTYQGRPITYDLEGSNELWHFDLQELAKSLQRNVSWQDPLLNGRFDFTRAGLGWVRYTQLLPGIEGNEQSILGLPDGGEVNIISEHPLTIPELENIAWVVAEAPRNTFMQGGVNETFFVMDELGEVRAKGGVFSPLGGLHDTHFGTIFIRTRELDRFEAVAFVLRHEAGHDIDARYGWLSKSLTGKDGKLLFGSGVLVLDKRGEVNPGKSSFESKYAATNSYEDFAETHEFLLRLREAYNSGNKGKDLLALSPAALHQTLNKRGISPDLQEKMFAIVDHVYSSRSTAK